MFLDFDNLIPNFKNLKTDLLYKRKIQEQNELDKYMEVIRNQGG